MTILARPARHQIDAWRARWIGLAGVLLCVIGSYGAGALSVHDPTKSWPLLGALRSGAGPQVALTFVYAGAAIVLIAWLFLGRLIRSADTAPTTRELLTTCVWWSAPLLISVPLFSRDLWSYAAQAHLTAHGLDPYAAGPDELSGPYLDEVQRAWVHSPAPYGPLWLIAGRLLAMGTGEHVYLTVWCLRLLSCLGVVLLTIFLPRLARAFGTDPRVATWLVVANPLLLMHFISGGHNDAVMLGLSVAGLTLVAERRRWVLGIVLVTLAVAIKAPAGLVLAFCVPVYAAGSRQLSPLRAVRQALLRMVPVSLLTFAVVTVVSGFGLGWVGHLNTAGGLVSWVSVPTGLALVGGHFAREWGFGDVHRILIPNLRLAGEAAAGLIATVLWLRGAGVLAALRARRGGGIRPGHVVRPHSVRIVRALGLSMTALVLLGPIVQPWYLLWPVALLAIAPLSRGWQTTIAMVTVWATLLVTPQGATLFDRMSAVLAAAVAAVVGTLIVLGHDHPQHPAGGPSDFPDGQAPGSRGTRDDPVPTTR